MKRVCTAAAAFLALAAGPAFAQTATPAPPSTDLGSKPGTLSDKLSDTNGVVAPTQNVDPGIRKPAPQTGTMPVIKPGAVAPGTAK